MQPPHDLDYRQNGVTTNKNPPWSIKIRAVNPIFAGSYADEVDDTPVMESFAEGHRDGKR
jgi:hypothetical protein